jgi:hypothetical protein
MYENNLNIALNILLSPVIVGSKVQVDRLENKHDFQKYDTGNE